MMSKWKNNDKWWVSSFNFKDEVTKQFEFQENIQYRCNLETESNPRVVIENMKVEIAKAC